MTKKSTITFIDGNAIIKTEGVKDIILYDLTPGDDPMGFHFSGSESLPLHFIATDESDDA